MCPVGYGMNQGQGQDHHKDHARKKVILEDKARIGEWKRCSFKRFRKVKREGAEVSSAGRAFQTRAPATEKARRPTVGSLTAGTHRSSEVIDKLSTPSVFRSTLNSLYRIVSYHTVSYHILLYPIFKSNTSNVDRMTQHSQG